MKWITTLRAQLAEFTAPIVAEARAGVLKDIAHRHPWAWRTRLALALEVSGQSNVAPTVLAAVERLLEHATERLDAADILSQAIVSGRLGYDELVSLAERAPLVVSVVADQLALTRAETLRLARREAIPAATILDALLTFGGALLSAPRKPAHV